MRRNIASQKWRVLAYSTVDGSRVLGGAAAITAKIRKDFGALAATNDVNPTEAEDGYYDFDLTAAETDAYQIDLYPESSASNVLVVPVPGSYVPQGPSSVSVVGSGAPFSPPPSSSNGEYITYADLVDRLGAKRDLQMSPREIMQLRTAVTDAYRDLPNQWSWKYYNRRIIIWTSPAVSATVTYDHTGGAYERLLTLTSGTVPDWAYAGIVKIGDSAYQIQKKISSTTLVLAETSNPGSDVASTSATIAREKYTLPYSIKRFNEVIATGSGLRTLSYTTESDVTHYRSYSGRLGSPTSYSTSPSASKQGALDISFSPIPTATSQVEINAEVYPRQLKVYELFGTDGASIGNNRFTSATGRFNPNCVGCALRISTTTAIPRSHLQYSESRDEYEVEVAITGVISATEVEVDSILPVVTGRGYTVSDIADIMPHVTMQLLEAMAHERFVLNSNFESNTRAQAVAEKNIELKKAVEADSNINWRIEQSGYTPTMMDGSANHDFSSHIHS
jgi:hypothetical protein